MPSGKYPGIGLLVALLLGAAIGATAMFVHEYQAQRRAITAFEEGHDLDLVAALESDLRADLANVRLAVHAPDAAAITTSAEHADRFGARVDELRNRTLSATGDALLGLGRVHERLQTLARAATAGDAIGNVPESDAVLDDLSRQLSADIGHLHDQLLRKRGNSATQVLPPFFVLTFFASMAGMLCALLYALARTALACAPASIRVPGARKNALLDSDQLDEALRHIADWALVCASDGSIQHVLAATDGKAGIHRHELSGQSLWKFTTDLHRDALAEPPHANSAAVSLTSFGATPETSIPVRMVVVGFESGGSRRLLAIVRDRSDEIDIEQSFNERTTQLLRARADVDRLCEKVMHVAEEEQERIGQDLHDGVGQQLTGISFLAHALASRIGEDDAKAGADLRWLSELTTRAVESVRGISRQFGARQFENGDIAALLAQLREDTKGAFDVDCQLSVQDADAELCGFGTSAKRHIFRFAQESLNNAVRHGHANLVVMRLEARRQRMRLTILDNGSGFDLRRFTGAARRGLGLHSMRMRASIIGGRLHIRTGARGTLVMLIAPLTALSDA